MNALYFIQGQQTKLIKIGVSKDPMKRLEDHQTSSPDRLTLLGAVHTYSEKYIHRRFERDRVHGEWFRPSEELLAFIKSLRLRGAKSSDRSLIAAGLKAAA